MLRALITAVAGILVMAVPVHAERNSINSNSILDWTGFYAGVLGGYGSGQGITNTTGTSTNVPLNGAIAGATGGFNKQFGKLVLGVEGDIAWTGQKGSATCVVDSSYACNADLHWIGSLRGRVGYTADRYLLYATAGAAFLGGNSNITKPGGIDPRLTGSYSDDYLGWTAGVGVEYAFTERLSVKAEYAYADYGSRTAPPGTVAGPATRIDITSHYGKLGLNLHF